MVDTLVMKDPLSWCESELDNLNKYWEYLSYDDRSEALYIISEKMLILDLPGMAFDAERVKKVRELFKSFDLAGK